MYYVATLALGLGTRQRACKVVSQEGSLRITLHVFENVGKCEGMNPHTPKATPKATPTLGNGVLMESQIFRGRFQGQNSMARVPYIIENFLELRCLKWAYITHLDI